MKATVFLQDELLLEAHRAARQMGISRSRPFSLALRDFLHPRHQKLLDKLNTVHATESPEEQITAPALKRRFRSTIKDRW